MVSLHEMSLPRKGNDVVIEKNGHASDDLGEPVDAKTKKKLGTRHDRRDMRRMGRMQELRVF
jgi:hypothetical protein